VALSADFHSYVLEQLALLRGVSSRRIFGGVGLYWDGLFFGLIDDDVLYLKVDDSNRSDYTARGMDAFRPFKDKPLYSMTYFEVPAEVLEEAELLVRWARKSCAVALTSRAATRSARKPVRRRASKEKTARTTRATHGK
jgi:DNA transformation protein and related proteins